MDQARGVLAEAHRTGETVILDSPVGAAGWQGIGWWQHLIARLEAEFPGTAFDAVLDCGDQPGLALAALRAGVKALRVTANDQTLAKLADIAARTGAVLDCADPSARGSTGTARPHPFPPSNAREIS